MRLALALALSFSVFTGCRSVLYLPAPLPSTPASGVEVSVGASAAPVEASAHVAAVLFDGVGVHAQGSVARENANGSGLYNGELGELGVVIRAPLSESWALNAGASAGRASMRTALVQGSVSRQSLFVGASVTPPVEFASGQHVELGGALRLTHAQIFDASGASRNDRSPREDVQSLFVEPVFRARASWDWIYVEQQAGVSVALAAGYNDLYQFLPVFGETRVGLRLDRLFGR